MGLSAYIIKDYTVTQVRCVNVKFCYLKALYMGETTATLYNTVESTKNFTTEIFQTNCESYNFVLKDTIWIFGIIMMYCNTDIIRLQRSKYFGLIKSTKQYLLTRIIIISKRQNEYLKAYSIYLLSRTTTTKINQSKYKLRNTKQQIQTFPLIFYKLFHC